MPLGCCGGSAGCGCEWALGGSCDVCSASGGASNAAGTGGIACAGCINSAGRINSAGGIASAGGMASAGESHPAEECLPNDPADGPAVGAAPVGDGAHDGAHVGGGGSVSIGGGAVPKGCHPIRGSIWGVGVAPKGSATIGDPPVDVDPVGGDAHAGPMDVGAMDVGAVCGIAFGGGGGNTGGGTGGSARGNASLPKPIDHIWDGAALSLSVDAAETEAGGGSGGGAAVCAAAAAGVPSPLASRTEETAAASASFWRCQAAEIEADRCAAAAPPENPAPVVSISAAPDAAPPAGGESPAHGWPCAGGGPRCCRLGWKAWRMCGAFSLRFWTIWSCWISCGMSVSMSSSRSLSF